MNVIESQLRPRANIACVGAGPGSLYLAILLKQSAPDWRVTVFERQSEGAALGWGVTIYLDDLAESDRASELAIRERMFEWRDNVVHVDGSAPVVVPTPGHSIGRRGLIEVLVARARAVGVELEFGREITDRSQLGEFDLVVAADGVNSGLRDAERRTFGTAIARGANKYMWLGTSRVFDAFTFAFVKTPAGWIWAFAYGFDDTASTFIVEASARTWSELHFDRMQADETMRRLEGLFAGWLDGHPLWPPAASRGALPWLEFSTVTNARWHSGPLVLLGDAAHTTHFSIGSGTRQAFADAISLASQLCSHARIEPALAAYEVERKAALHAVQVAARNSAAWFEDVPRYIQRDPKQFTDLLYSRASPLLHRMPPSMFLHLQKASQRNSLVVQGGRHVWRVLNRR